MSEKRLVELLTEREATALPSEHALRSGPWQGLFLLLMPLLITVPICLILGIRDRLVFWIALSVAALPMALMSYVCIATGMHTLRGWRRPSNWLIKRTDRGVYLHLRAYQNWRGPDDQLTAAFLPFDQIDSVFVLTEKHVIRRFNGRRRVRRRRCLVFDIPGVDTALLREAVAAERNRRAVGGIRVHHLPVRVEAPGLVSVDISPRRVMKLLPPHVTIQKPLKFRTGASDGATESEKIDGQIVAMIEAGHTIDAVWLVRTRYGMSLTEARAFVRELASPLTNSPTPSV